MSWDNGTVKWKLHWWVTRPTQNDRDMETKMAAIARWLLRWRGAPLMAAVFAIVASGTLVARGTSSGSADDQGSVGWLSIVLVGVIGTLFVLVALRLLAMLAGVDPDAKSIAQRLTNGPDQQRLLARWLQRTRWARNVGGIAGLVWWAFGTSGQGDVLLCGVGGIALGSMVAQLHHIRPVTGPRTASLEHRSVHDYIPAEWRRRMIAVGALASLLVAGGFIVADAGAAVWWGIAVLVVLGSAYFVQWRVAARRRPALSTGLQQADNLARELAIDRGLAQPATYFALALFAHGAGSFEASFGGAATAVSVVAWLYALYLWWNNRRLGLDHILNLEHAQPVAA